MDSFIGDILNPILKAVHASMAADAKNSETFRKIEARLAAFRPPIVLKDHIVDDPTPEELKVHRNTLGGVDFAVKSRVKFVQAFRNARKGDDSAFAAGGTKAEDWKEHWALAISFLSTNGIGFREPWQFFLNDRDVRMEQVRPLLLDAPEMDGFFAANFGDDIRMDFSALHASVAEFQSFKTPIMANVHVDDAGITMVGPNNQLSITPNVITHLFNELLFKTFLDGILPDSVIDRFNFNIASPYQNFSRLGMSFDLAKTDTYRWTVNTSVGLTAQGSFEFSATTGIAGTHDFLGAPPRRRRRSRR